MQDSTGTGLGGTGGGELPSDSSFTDPNPAATNTWHFTDSTQLTTYSGIFDINNTDTPQGGFLQIMIPYILLESHTTDHGVRD